MASLYPSSQSIIGFNRPTCRAERTSINFRNLGPNFLSTPPNFRPKIAVRLQGRQRLLAVFSTNSNSSEGNSVAQKSNGVKTSDDSSTQGPPFLTILAGLVVLFLVIWVFGSIVMWLSSLVVNVPPSK